MTPQEITQAKIFNSADEWHSFRSLVDAHWKLMAEWYNYATQQLRLRLSSAPYDNWSWSGTCIEKHKPHDTSTRFYISACEEDSIQIGFHWNYELHLRIFCEDLHDSAKIDKLLQTSEFSCILGAFNKIEKSFETYSKAVNYRNFRFDGRSEFSVEELAWYAGNRTEEFVNQAIEAIERFTKDPLVTEKLELLNKLTLIDNGQTN